MRDLIDRQEAMDIIQKHMGDVCDGDATNNRMLIAGYRLAHEHLKAVISALPSAQPEHITGRWIYGAEGTFGTPCGHYCCSVCGQRLAWRENFCPNCGAEMKGEK